MNSSLPLADVVPPEVRSRMMSGIRSKDTKPELLIRKGLHAAGFRYRLHAKDLPGKPDLVFPRYRAVIFVHGCFWHGHDCHLFKWPKSREDFWRRKIDTNRRNDVKHLSALKEAGWRVLVIWECALKGKLRMPAKGVIEETAGWLGGKMTAGDIRGIAPEDSTCADRTRRDKKSDQALCTDEIKRRSRTRVQTPGSER